MSKEYIFSNSKRLNNPKWRTMDKSIFSEFFVDFHVSNLKIQYFIVASYVVQTMLCKNFKLDVAVNLSELVPKGSIFLSD
jgi:hypothetical protein